MYNLEFHWSTLEALSIHSAFQPAPHACFIMADVKNEDNSSVASGDLYDQHDDKSKDWNVGLELEFLNAVARCKPVGTPCQNKYFSDIDTTASDRYPQALSPYQYPTTVQSNKPYTVFNTRYT